ncbi:histidinol-phosphate transaminase [Psychrobacillus psychrodurans]|uniref:Histidinol-phosphate aminotransferase n=1 Tax=Psychrobacillus psychrodurans TaxID=126157 RepID=A0A9X3L6I8_9BACI|nr:histidinol-phosphate transaminase [Psychrobacillus psychrodurans]MCZ8532313.1 histidinol-phosphate transaminase [Psychrobacillus psychrodurans]
MKFKQQINGLHAYQPGKTSDEVKKMFNLEKVTKLASNENPYGASPKVQEYFANANLDFAIYPDGYASNLRTAVANHLNISEKQLLFGNGSDENILIVSRAILRPGLNTIMADLTFGQYKHNAIVEGAEVREIALTNNGEHDLNNMLAAIDENTAIIWVCNPNNPTGTLTPSDKLKDFIEKVPKDVLIVLDEAYTEYITDNNYKDSLGLLENHPNILIMRTFSKAYGLASFRIGYAIGSEEVIAQLEPTREPFNNTIISQKVALIGLEDQAFIELCKEKNNTGKAQFVAYCEERNLDYFPSQTNFILMEIKANSDVVFQGLMKRGFIVRSGNALGKPGYLRITIGTEQQNSELLEKLDEVLKEEGVL